MKNFMGIDEFPWLSLLEEYTNDIRNECLAVKDEFQPWPETEYHNGLWHVYGIYDYPFGRSEYQHKAPITADLIKNIVPNHGAAGFTLLKPGAKIYPHRGLIGAILRIHLPLIVPDGDVAFSVRGETHRWVEGKTWVFNDRLHHEAWNNTQYNRYILVIDFKREARPHD